jgi:hypothetical protein
MSINANITRVVSCSAGVAASQRQSCSFAKLYIIETAVFETIDFGLAHTITYIDDYQSPKGAPGFGSGSRSSRSNVFNTVNSLKATAGSYIEGPIASFNLASGGCLAYDTSGPLGSR